MKATSEKARIKSDETLDEKRVEFKESGREMPQNVTPSTGMAEPSRSDKDIFERAEFETPNLDDITSAIMEHEASSTEDIKTSIGKGFKQSQRGLFLAKAFENLKSDEKAQVVEKMFAEGYFDDFGPESKGFLNSLGEMIGAQALPLMFTMAGGPLAPATGAVAGIESSRGQEFASTYIQAVEAGKSREEATATATHIANIGSVSSALENVLGAIPIIKGTTTIGGALVKAGADATTDAVIAGVFQTIQNKALKFEDIPTEWYENVAETMGGEAFFSAVMNAVGLKGSIKYAAQQKMIQRLKDGEPTQADLKVLSRMKYLADTEQTAKAIDKFNKGEGKKGLTLDVDMVETDFDDIPNTDVVTVRSKRIEGDVTSEKIHEFTNENIDVIDEFGANEIKLGVSKNEAGETEIEMVMIRPESKRSSTMAIALENEQNTIYSTNQGSVKTGRTKPKSDLTEQEIAQVQHSTANLDKAIAEGDIRKAEDILAEINMIKQQAKARMGENLTEGEQAKITELEKKMKDHLMKNEVKEAKAIVDEIGAIKDEAAGREEVIPKGTQTAFEGKEGIDKLKAIIAADDSKTKAQQKKAEEDRIAAREEGLKTGKVKEVAKTSDGEGVYETKIKAGTYEVEHKGRVVTIEKNDKKKWDQDQKEVTDPAKKGLWRITEGDTATGTTVVHGYYNTKKDAENAVKVGLETNSFDVDQNNTKSENEYNTEKVKRKMHQGAERMMQDPDFAELGKIIEKNIDEFSYYVFETGKTLAEAQEQSIGQLQESRAKRKAGKTVTEKIRAYAMGDTEGMLNDIALFQKLEAEGRHDEASEIYLDLEKSGELAGRMLNAMARIKGASPKGVADAIIKSIERKKSISKKKFDTKTLTPKQITNIKKHVDDLFKLDKQIQVITEKSKKRDLTPDEYDQVVKMKIERERIMARVSIASSRYGGTTIGRKMTNWIRGSLLGSTSLVVNVVGNVPHAIGRISGGLVRSYMQNRIEAGTGLTAREELSVGMKSFWRGIKRSAKEARTGEFLMESNKFDQTERINGLREWGDLFKGLVHGKYTEFSDSMARNEKGEVSVGTALGVVGDMTVGMVPDIVFRGLRIGDQAFRTSARVKEIFRQARKHEGAKIKNVNDAEAWFLRLEHAEPKTYDKVSQVVKRAEDFAVFTHDTRLSNAAESIMKGTRGVAGKMAGKYAEGAVETVTTAVVPFVKIPTNLISMGADIVVPIKPVMEVHKALSTGDLDNVDEALGSLMMSGVAYGLYALASASGSINLLTDDEELDAAKRAVSYTKGAPSSMNFSKMLRFMTGQDDWDKTLPGDFTASTLNVGPLGIAITMMGAMDKSIKNKDFNQLDEVEVMYEHFKSIFDGVKNTAFNMSMLAGVTEFIKLIEGNSPSTYAFNSLAKTIGSPLVPRLLEQTLVMPLRETKLNNRQMDFYTRWQADMYNSSILAALPGTDITHDETLAHLNVFGDIAPLPLGEEPFMKFVSSALDPFKTKKIVATDLELEIFDIMEEANQTNIITYPPNTVTLVGEADGLKKSMRVKLDRMDYNQMVIDIQGEKEQEMGELVQKRSFQNLPVKKQAFELKMVDRGVTREKAKWQGMMQEAYDAGEFEVRRISKDPEVYEIVGQKPLEK
jgi:hypothetical protein